VFFDTEEHWHLGERSRAACGGNPSVNFGGLKPLRYDCCDDRSRGSRIAACKNNPFDGEQTRRRERKYSDVYCQDSRLIFKLVHERNRN
jgi:hypothetical protein